MKCDTKTMVKAATGLGLLAIIAYVALPQFRTFILSISPFLLALVCPLSMLIMMKGMSSSHAEQEARPGPTKAQEPAKQMEVEV
jgi:Protein of unknown function (DUF2933)